MIPAIIPNKAWHHRMTMAHEGYHVIICINTYYYYYHFLGWGGQVFRGEGGRGFPQGANFQAWVGGGVQISLLGRGCRFQG